MMEYIFFSLREKLIASGACGLTVHLHPIVCMSSIFHIFVFLSRPNGLNSIKLGNTLHLVGGFDIFKGDD